MTTSRLFSRHRPAAGRILSLLILSGCAAETTTSPGLQGPNFAPAGSGDPTVRRTDPDSGFQNTTIDVRVLGSGFDNGSTATWALAGDTAFAQTKIKTNSTRFVKSGELVANITIGADAPLALFDVVVVTSGGKKGIGIEKFEVKQFGRSGIPYTGLFDDGAGNLLRSDGGIYTDGVSCVSSLRTAGGFYQLRTIHPMTACKAVPRPGWRFFTIDFGTGPAFDLDQDGSAEAIEQAPGRLLADNALAKGKTSTAVKIYILEVLADGSTTLNTKWTLLYKNNQPVSGSTVRVIQALPGAAAVDLYAAGVSVPAATIQLPFKLTLTPQ